MKKRQHFTKSVDYFGYKSKTSLSRVALLDTRNQKEVRLRLVDNESGEI